ncbi:MAG TPA: Sec-independent protein translocase protein TatB [Xanthobacteraceae bacterium]|nr:Sec-independent protein translocase protein TatB [Xanthobacteraceae bacterium]
MFDIAWGEFVVIAVVALIVIGPKELPAVLRAIGQWTTKIRRMAAEFQGQFQEALREAEMADLKKDIDDASRGFTSQFDDPLNIKEATKWEPKPDTERPPDINPPDIKPDDIKLDDNPDDAAKLADGSPKSAPVTPDGYMTEEAFPVAADHPAIEQTPTPPGGEGKGGGTADATAAPPVTPPAAQPPLSEERGQGRVEGGVHS